MLDGAVCARCGGALAVGDRFCTVCGSWRPVAPAIRVPAPPPPPRLLHVSVHDPDDPYAAIPAEPPAPSAVRRPERRIYGILLAPLVATGWGLGFAALLPVAAWRVMPAFLVVLLTLLLPWALAGGAALIYLRPSRLRLQVAATVLGLSALALVLIWIAGYRAYNYYDFSYLGVPSAMAWVATLATAAWLVLRRRSAPRYLVLVIPIGVGLALSAVGYGYGMVSRVVPLLGAVVAAWLAAVGTGPWRPSKPVELEGFPGRYQALPTPDGDVLVAAPAAVRTNRMAILSLALALTVAPALAGVPAIATGHVARSQIRWRGEAGDRVATAGLLIGYLTLAITLLFVIALVVSSTVRGWAGAAAS